MWWRSDASASRCSLKAALLHAMIDRLPARHRNLASYDRWVLFRKSSVGTQCGGREARLAQRVSDRANNFRLRMRRADLLRQRHLDGAAQVIEQIADFLIAHGLQQAIRHHRELALLQRLDLVARQNQGF